MTISVLKYVVILVVIISVGWSSYAVIHNGYYPVAMVNWKLITNRHWSMALASAFQYYRNFKKPEIDEATFQKELRRAVLDKLVENQLVFGELQKDNLDGQVAAFIKQNPDVEKVGPTAYNMPRETFFDLVIKPQVAMEVLQQKLKTKNQAVDVWLQKQKTSAKVLVFAQGLYWSGTEVVVE